MVKRPSTEANTGQEAYQKRQKISGPRSISAIEDVQSGKQLQRLLVFDQDNGRSKHGIQTFKSFLDSFSTPESDTALRVRILKEYFDLEKPLDEEDKEAVYLSNIMQTWSFASQSNNESLLSAVPAVLALLFKTISSIFEFTEYGTKLGRTILQKRQQELIARGLTANKTKEFIISPCLRLLKEVTSFNGGALARSVFRGRDHTFKSLARNLGLKHAGDTVEDRRKPSVRTNAVRFLLTTLKFLPAEAKRELLNQKDIVSALTRDIRDDPPYIVLEILETLTVHVLRDEGLPRDAKTKIINGTLLQRITTLYGYSQLDDEESKNKKSVDQAAHEFLILACTSPDFGVLNYQTGFYPRGVDPDQSQDMDGDSHIDLGLDNIEWIKKYTGKVPIRNTILSDFIQHLRPWSNTRQRDLLLAIFGAAPELVADYFFGKQTFPFDPKLTATWVGYSSFLFSSLQLPIPQYFGHKKGYARLPPPPSIVLESILPQPLTQKALTRCLNQPYHMITFFAIRILSVAFAKLKVVLKTFHEAAAASSSIWTQAANKLLEEFRQRCPSIKDIIGVYRNMHRTDFLQREAATRLLILYYETVPQIALDAKFDVSGALAQALDAVEDSKLGLSDRALLVMELENLFQFARFSPGMRWFTKAEGRDLSPFMAMLKLLVDAPSDVPLVRLRNVMASIMQEHRILQSDTATSALNGLVWLLKSGSGKFTTSALYEWLDSCISRCTSKPVKYIFALEELQAKVYGPNPASTPVSLLTMAIIEQWPFVLKSGDENLSIDVAHFVANYIAMSIKANEDVIVLKDIVKILLSQTSIPDIKTIIETAPDLVGNIMIPVPQESSLTKEEGSITNEKSFEDTKNEIITKFFEDVQTAEEDPSFLVKWTSKDVDEVIEDGYAAKLVMLLSSSHLSVRKEAMTNISKLAAKLKDSTFAEKDQIWLLLCEVVETARKITDQHPLPAVIASFASHVIKVLNDPLHCLYPKINKFLSQGPNWDVDKVPLMFKILDEPPSLDDGRYVEIGWLLGYMLDGLRTPEDMAIFRKRKVFEKLLSLYNNPYLASFLRDKILQIVFKASTIEGGSTTLVTRFSSVTWFQVQLALGSNPPLKVLMERILESCDQNRIGVWTSKGVGQAKVDALRF
ncbi:ribosome 60S biogenesis N-terminal-domain-containing protein [Xylogone sp. PMI_703]|nr:ribosome 60S biogenesis N-terminal-domain-containing protein [Xylogone sp. PMI_703]